MSIQLTLPIPAPKTPALNLVGLVRQVLLDNEWLTPYQIQVAIKYKTGEWHSDSSISARLRDLRKADYGGYLIEKRKRLGSKSYEYRLAGVA